MAFKTVTCSRIDNRMIFDGKINTPSGAKIWDKWSNTWRLGNNWSLVVDYGLSFIRIELLEGECCERVYILEYSLPSYRGQLTYDRDVLYALKEINKQLKNHGIVNFDMEIKEYRKIYKEHLLYNALHHVYCA